MPAGYILSHLFFSAICLIVAFRLPPRSRAGYVLGGALLVMLIGGFAVEHRQSWAWAAMRVPGSDLVFLTNLFLEGTVVLCALLWRSALERKARWRAGVLSVVLLGASLGSYAWYFGPTPAPLTGSVDRNGFCPQTTHDSCSAASATMLLAWHHVPTTEAEMAELCLTRSGHGTTPLGLYRGLTLRAASHGLCVRLISISKPSEIRKSDCPCILSVGLKSGCPTEVNDRMISYGWEPGLQHTVVIMDADPAGQWVDVADPTNGKERWSTADLRYLWDGYALILVAR